ncbi:MAG: hypothetical protein KDD70_16015, partial [Bdellovibrionales bacterium]|nr:hypothetical protein [Bdellovibrionales bacterium]
MDKSTPSHHHNFLKTLTAALIEVRPVSMLILTESAENHWARDLLLDDSIRNSTTSIQFETRRIIPLENLPNIENFLAFNASVYTPLRNLSSQKLEEFVTSETQQYSQREAVPDSEIENLKRFEFIIVDDSLLASEALAEEFRTARYLFITGIKTFKGFSTYSSLLKQPNCALISEDHSSKEGCALFRRDPNVQESVPLENQERTSTFETEEQSSRASSSDRFDYPQELEPLPPPLEEETQNPLGTCLVVIPPEPDKAFHVYPLLEAIAKSQYRGELFVVCEEQSRELYSRLSQVTKLFSYESKILHEERIEMKGLVKNLSLLPIDKAILLSEEDHILSALLTYEFNNSEATLLSWTEISGRETPFSPQNVSTFAKNAGLPLPSNEQPFPLETWEEQWGERFLENHGLHKENTLLLFSKGKYPVELYVRALEPFLERGEYSLLVVDAHTKNLSEKLPEKGAAAIQHTLTLGQFAALMAKSRVTIGGESIRFYLSSYLKVPHVLVAGGGALSQSFPHTERTVVA